MLEPMCAAKGLKCRHGAPRKTGVIVADRIRINSHAQPDLQRGQVYAAGRHRHLYLRQRGAADARIRFGFELRDTGIGMSREFQEKMFEPFTQSTTTPRARRA